MWTCSSLESHVANMAHTHFTELFGVELANSGW